MNGNKPATPTEWVDPDDAPELPDAFFTRADEFKSGAGETWPANQRRAAQASYHHPPA
jgi:hypothetical protein